MARAVDMSATTYQHYEDRYKKQYLPYDFLLRVCQVLEEHGVRREFVDELSPKLSNVVEDVTSTVSAPLISWVQAGELAEVVDPYSLGSFEKEIIVEYNRESVIALRVKGSSLNRVAPDGSIIIVDYTLQELVPEKFYVLRVEGEATVKRYQTNPDRFEPFSTEPDHPIVFPSDGLYLVGRVVRVVTEL